MTLRDTWQVVGSEAEKQLIGFTTADGEVDFTMPAHIVTVTKMG